MKAQADDFQDARHARLCHHLETNIDCSFDIDKHGEKYHETVDAQGQEEVLMKSGETEWQTCLVDEAVK